MRQALHLTFQYNFAQAPHIRQQPQTSSPRAAPPSAADGLRINSQHKTTGPAAMRGAGCVLAKIQGEHVLETQCAVDRT